MLRAGELRAGRLGEAHERAAGRSGPGRNRRSAAPVDFNWHLQALTVLTMLGPGPSVVGWLGLVTGFLAGTPTSWRSDRHCPLAFTSQLPKRSHLAKRL
jgi:hypothetical protein